MIQKLIDLIKALFLDETVEERILIAILAIAGVSLLVYHLACRCTN